MYNPALAHYVPSCLGSLCANCLGSLCVFQVLTELLCVVASLSFCPRECRSHCCSCHVGLKPIALASKIANYFSSRFSPAPSLAHCEVSNDQCYGDQRCPGFDGRLYRPSSCHNADNNFDGCGNRFQARPSQCLSCGFQQHRRDDLVTLISPRKLHLHITRPVPARIKKNTW